MEFSCLAPTLLWDRSPSPPNMRKLPGNPASGGQNGNLRMFGGFRVVAAGRPPRLKMTGRRIFTMGRHEAPQQLALARYSWAVKHVDRIADAVLVRPGKLAKSKPLNHYPLDPVRVREVAGVQRLAELGPRTARTLEAQTLLDDSVLLPLLRIAAQNQELVWFVSPKNATEVAELQKCFGGTIHCVSCTRAAAQGATPRPDLFAAKPEEILRERLAEDPNARESFRQIDAGRVTPRLARTLTKHGVEMQHDSWLLRVLRHPLFSVYAVVFVYSALRALPVAFVREFHGSLLLFWTIDIVTAIPYTWGVLAMLFGRTRIKRLAGAVTTIVTFVSPYVYFWLNGSDYPTYVPAVIVGLTLATISIELAKYLQERNLERVYLRGLGLD